MSKNDPVERTVRDIRRTLSEFNLRSTTTAMHRLVNSSITVSMRNFLPSCVRSMTKS